VLISPASANVSPSLSSRVVAARLDRINGTVKPCWFMPWEKSRLLTSGATLSEMVWSSLTTGVKTSWTPKV